jgi:TRAP-type C4-dicarboxylate transport system permease large subunit
LPWFGVIIVMAVELGLIHPPVGMNVFVIKSVIKDVSPQSSRAASCRSSSPT